jgi:ATP-dependent RNA helicase RhlE
LKDIDFSDSARSNFSSTQTPSTPANTPDLSGQHPFQALGLLAPIVRAVRDQGYDTPTVIQQRAIPQVLAGKDVLGWAPTGTGKTAAFALPILQRLAQAGRSKPGFSPIRVLVLSPTRELATQIGESFTVYGRHTGLKNTVIIGGVSQNAQAQALKNGVDIVVATPGRLCDLLQQKVLSLSSIEVLVLDEADRMLDMGFLPDVRRIVRLLPKQRQTLLFSATMPAPIQDLANTILSAPVIVQGAPVATLANGIEQSVYMVDHGNKRALLAHLLSDRSITRALIFTRTKRGANKVTEQLARVSVRAEAIHGNKSQGARTRALARFKDGSIRVLVATDIAARGIDVDGITHVINYDLPSEPESYVHRIGRTARAGAAGRALSFCGPDERRAFSQIERLIHAHVPVVKEHPFSLASGAQRGHLPS